MLSLGHAFGFRKLLPLGLNHGQLLVPVDEDVVRDVRLGASPLTHQATLSDVKLATDTRAVDDAPTGRPQGRIDQLGACLRLIAHGCKQSIACR